MFIGRELELRQLKELYQKKRPSLVVLKGRRRIGKSRLIVEFASKSFVNRLWNFSGLAPQEKINGQTQRDHFARQLSYALQAAPFTFKDWSDAFEFLASHLKPGDIVLLDEISWMGSGDPTFIPKLKAWWDKQTKHFMLVFCGSVSTWIEENILKSTAFFGRVHLTLTLSPLSISESTQLLGALGFRSSAYDTYKLLSILGGIPWYLEQVSSGQSVDQIIQQLCFSKEGLLVLEFDRIFHDLFNERGMTYKKILNSLKDGMKTLSEIRKAIHFAHSGTLSAHLEHLIIAGFVKKQELWSIKTMKSSKQSLYRISDPYMRFYLKMIEPNKNKMEWDAFKDFSLYQLPGFEAHIGLQLEQLLLQNRRLLLEAIGIPVQDVVSDGPYRQSKTTSQRGCQVDYLVQTRTKNLYICEFKFKRRELGQDIIEAMQGKLEALKAPKGFAKIPLLFHIGGVSSSVATGDYFYRIVDIADFLEMKM